MHYRRRVRCVRNTAKRSLRTAGPGGVRRAAFDRFTAGGVGRSALSSRDQLVGFVHHLVAVFSGEVAGYSHMMAVAVDYQTKVWERSSSGPSVPARSAKARDFIKWTWEPMRARNAHFNLNRLGVIVEAYTENFYGTTTALIQLRQRSELKLIGCLGVGALVQIEFPRWLKADNLLPWARRNTPLRFRRTGTRCQRRRANGKTRAATRA